MKKIDYKHLVKKYEYVPKSEKEVKRFKNKDFREANMNDA